MFFTCFSKGQSGPNGEAREAAGHEKFAALLPDEVVGQGGQQAQQTGLGLKGTGSGKRYRT